MGYVADGKLENFGRLEPLEEAARRTVKRVGDLLHERVVHHTPVAKPPNAAVSAEWLEARRRLPGTLRESWKVGEVAVSENGESFSIDVYTMDPVAPHVEWPTRPHLIVPRRPGGWLRFWDREGRTVFALIVHHPGTQGSYMMTTALAEVAQLWREIGAEELERWASEQARLVTAG